MELIPEGQALEEYLETEPPRSGHVSPVTMLGTHTTELQPNTPAQSNSQLSPFPSLPLPNLPLRPAPVHPFFNQFSSASQTPNPSSSRQATPLVLPRVLLRPPSGTTRHLPSQKSPETPNTQQTRAVTPANSKTNLAPENPAHHGPSQTVLSAPPHEATHPSTIPATTFPAISQDLEVAGRPQTPPPTRSNATSSQNKLSPSQQVFNYLTKVDPKALKFQDGDFFTMMVLRAERKWDSRKMGKSEWANVVQLFNKTRQEKEPSQELVPIQGKVFQDEFLKVERTISERLLAGKFEAKSGNETFWQKHCYAVPGFGPDPSAPAASKGQAKSALGTADPSSIKGKGKGK
ncbi:hypothetical protein FRC04_009873, partial [Tulasnella sp. 424]